VAHLPVADDIVAGDAADLHLAEEAKEVLATVEVIGGLYIALRRESGCRPPR
jgi:hypothetical protein